jgi:site-specific DNA-methyltransferase (adenine-specific)
VTCGIFKGKFGRDNEHATKKPIELCERAIRHATHNKEIVLDLFGGSGSTLIACEQLNRICYMMELDERYCDVIVRRWEEFTGKKAQLMRK